MTKLARILTRLTTISNAFLLTRIIALGDKISGSKRLLFYREISLESRRLFPDILSHIVYRVRTLFPANLKSCISMFLMVISVNHTNTRFKVSLWILLAGKSAGSCQGILCCCGYTKIWINGMKWNVMKWNEIKCNVMKLLIQTPQQQKEYCYLMVFFLVMATVFKDHKVAIFLDE